jgi:O-antigen/teichoic acid export membrane protein
MASSEKLNATTPPDDEAFSVGRAKNAAWAIVALRPLRSAVGAIALLVLVRYMDEEDYGAYQIYYSIIAFLSMAASLGISNTIARYLPEYYKAGRFGLSQRLVKMAARLRLLSNVIILGIIWIFWEPLTALLNFSGYSNSYFVFCGVAITFFQTSLLITVLSSYLLQKRTLWLQVMFPAVKTAGYIIAARYQLELTIALVVDLVAFVLMWIGLRVIYHTEIPTVPGEHKFSAEESKRIIRYGFFYNFNDMGQIAVGKRVDNFFIASMMNVASVGAYGLAVRLLEIVRGFVPDKFFFDVIRPLFFTLDPSEDSSRVTHYFQLLVKSNYIVFMPVTAVVFLVHSEILDVAFGGKFIEHSALLAWVFGFAALTAFDKPLRLVVQLRERAAIQFMAKLFGIYNVVALLVLIPHFGLVGAAVATRTTDILVKAFLWWFVRDHASFAGMQRFFLVTLGVWASYVIVTYFAISAIHSPLGKLACALAMAFAWWLAYLRLSLLSSDEADTIESVLRHRYRTWLIRAGVLPDRGHSFAK